MKPLSSQLFKLFIVTKYLIQQYAKIFYSYDEVRSFFTNTYVKSRATNSLFDQGLSRKSLESIFPGATSVSVNIYAQSKSLLEDNFSQNTNYLVSPQELYTLATMVKFLNPKTVFEFGTYKGWTLANIHSNMDASSSAYSIDLSPRLPNDPFVKSHLDASNVKILTGNTYTYDFSPYEGKMDFIFVDGGHDYETVKNDSGKALKMVSDKGVIVWHDYNKEVHPGVYRYLMELSQTLPIIAIGSTSMAIYKK